LLQLLLLRGGGRREQNTRTPHRERRGGEEEANMSDLVVLNHLSSAIGGSNMVGLAPNLVSSFLTYSTVIYSSVGLRIG